jgi:hypothetical protein
LMVLGVVFSYACISKIKTIIFPIYSIMMEFALNDLFNF